MKLYLQITTYFTIFSHLASQTTLFHRQITTSFEDPGCLQWTPSMMIFSLESNYGLLIRRHEFIQTIRTFRWPGILGHLKSCSRQSQGVGSHSTMKLTQSPLVGLAARVDSCLIATYLNEVHSYQIKLAFIYSTFFAT